MNSATQPANRALIRAISSPCRLVLCGLLSGSILFFSGRCTSTPEPNTSSIGEAWQQSHKVDTPPAASSTDGQAPIAWVNDAPLDRGRFIALLMAGRGVAVLDELIVLQLAQAATEKEGLVISSRDVEAERDRSLAALLSPLPAAESADFDRSAAEDILDQVLVGNGMSRAEYDIGMIRNAHLRKLAMISLQISEPQLREEFGRAMAERVVIRHIQLAAKANATEVLQQIDKGADFAELARRYSANLVTGAAGGLLGPFSRSDLAIPPLIRETAFSLEVGQVSNPVRVDNWNHILRIEQRLPASSQTLEEARHDLEKRLRERLIPVEMQRLSAELFEQAEIRVTEPGLRADFLKRYPQQSRSSP